jgi:hypothetical protein
MGVRGKVSQGEIKGVSDGLSVSQESISKKWKFLFLSFRKRNFLRNGQDVQWVGTGWELSVERNGV